MDYDYLFKVILVGDASVGKTSLVQSYAKGFCPANELPTIGVDVVVKTVEINGKLIKFRIWDSAGQERFKSITTSYYRSADAVIIAYAIDSEASFEHLVTWMQDVDNYAKEDAVKVLVGNKRDLRARRAVSEQQAIDFALMTNADATFECSARESDNVDYLFFCMAKKLMHKVSCDPYGMNNNDNGWAFSYVGRRVVIKEPSPLAHDESTDSPRKSKSPRKHRLLEKLCNFI